MPPNRARKRKRRRVSLSPSSLTSTSRSRIHSAPAQTSPACSPTYRHCEDPQPSPSASPTLEDNVENEAASPEHEGYGISHSPLAPNWSHSNCHHISSSQAAKHHPQDLDLQIWFQRYWKSSIADADPDKLHMVRVYMWTLGGGTGLTYHPRTYL